MAIELPYFQDLQTASWRGVPFGVDSSEGHAGRKNATHSYPFKDFDWIEDMGRQSRTLNVHGFLVEGGGAYGGAGSVIEQRNRMVDACEQPGDGELVHPTLGANLLFSLLNFEWTESKERGRVIEIALTLKESQQQAVTSTSTINTQGTSLLAALQADVAIVQDYIAQAHAYGVGIVQAILTPVNIFGTLARSLTFAATSLVTMVSALPGEIGRLVGASFPGRLKNRATTVQTLLGQASAAQEAVLQAVSSLSAAAASNDAVAVANGVLAVTHALLAANPDPARAIQSMLALVAGSPAMAQTTAATTAANQAVTDLIRRSAVVGMAKASAQYQPTSYNDARSTRQAVCSAIDDEMVIAGDEGNDASYNALRDLKIAVAQDLTQRGADLATVISVSSPQPLSSLVWAQRLYQDAGREKQLVQGANPKHPAFMPTSFQALAQ